MSDFLAHGPEHPNRIIFVSVALVATVIGVGTGDIRLFFLTVIGCTVLSCASYALIRHRLGWKPLSFDYLFELLRLLSPS